MAKTPRSVKNDETVTVDLKPAAKAIKDALENLEPAGGLDAVKIKAALKVTQKLLLQRPCTSGMRCEFKKRTERK